MPGRLQLCDIWKVRRAQFSVLVAIAAVAFLGLKNAAADEPKRVLLVHSFGSAAPPFTVESTAFETELVGKMGDRVDLDEVSLDMARYPDRDMQEAIVDYLQKRQAKWQPDLVVPIGSPAAIFVATYRDRLFPETPILYASADRRLLPPGALEKNAAYVGQIYEIPGFLEDMLQIAPATKNIVVIVGATPLEHLLAGRVSKGSRATRRPDKLHLLQRSLLQANEGAGLDVAARFLHFFSLPASRCRRCNPQRR